MSPDSPEPETEFQLTPRTEAKYSKIDEEFQMMLQRNHINGQRVCLKLFKKKLCSGGIETETIIS